MGQFQQSNNNKEYEECAGHWWPQFTVTGSDIGQGGGKYPLLIIPGVDILDIVPSGRTGRS